MNVTVIGAVAVVAALLIGLHRLVRTTGRATYSVSALLVAWFFAALFLTWSEFYQGAANRFPTLPFGLLIPIAAGIVLFWRWSWLRRIVDAVPQQWIASVQVYRVLGLTFLVLYAAGQLPGEFAWPAGVGDILVGLLAPVAGIAYARRWNGSTGLLRVWNLLGLTDLLVALVTGFLTSPSPVQLLALDRPNHLISAFPLAMIPVFLVPLSILLHLASLHKLRQPESAPHTYSISVMNP
jgi:hypothetical protein